MGLWLLVGSLFLTAAMLQRVGAEKSWIPHGTGYNNSFTFDPAVLSTYNFAAFTFLVLGVLCLLATLLLHAARWKPAAS